MGIIRGMIEKRSQRDPFDDYWYGDVKSWSGLKYLSGGIVLDEASTLSIIAVYSCVNLLASDLGTLPLPVYQRKRPRNKSRNEDHPMYHLLHDEPNPEQTSTVWRGQMMAHTLLWGNGYSEIEFGNDGKPKALWPLPTWRVKTLRTEKRDLFYEVGLSNIGTGDNVASFYGDTLHLPPYKVFHTPALSISGIAGLSPVRQAMAAIGLAKAAEEMGARLFGQGANMGGVVTHPGKMTKEASERLEDSLNKNYQGLGKAHRIMLLEEGMQWAKVGVNPDEAQFLETRKFQRGEIASLFRIPPHMIGDTEKSTSWGTGIEQQNIGYVQHTLRPWLVLWEQEIKRKLFRYDNDHFAEFVVEGLLRGDAKTRSAYYHNALLDGWMNRDEVREKENMNPIPNGEGEKYFKPLNMQETGDANGSNSGALREVIREIAEREKRNILRAAEREGENFGDWLEDFYRDFEDWISRQFEAVIGDRAVYYTERYIEASRRRLEGVDVSEIAGIMEDWEEERINEEAEHGDIDEH